MIRRRHAVGVVLGAIVAVSALAAQPKEEERQSFKATTVNVNPGAGEAVKIDVLHWSKDEERNELLALVDKGDTQLFDSLKAKPSVGYIWTSGALGYPVRYACRVPLPDGGERVIVVTDLKLGVWDRNNVWKATAQPAPVDYPFTLIELRLNRKGEGEGKMSLATKVTADQQSKTIALENYATTPILLKGVKREQQRR